MGSEQLGRVRCRHPAAYAWAGRQGVVAQASQGGISISQGGISISQGGISISRTDESGWRAISEERLVRVRGRVIRGRGRGRVRVRVRVRVRARVRVRVRGRVRVRKRVRVRVR